MGNATPVVWCSCTQLRLFSEITNTPQNKQQILTNTYCLVNFKITLHNAHGAYKFCYI